MTSDVALSDNQWVRICAVAHLYGFTPWAPGWDEAMANVAIREGKDHGFEWWSAAVFYVHEFSPDENKEFKDALGSARDDEFRLLENEITSHLSTHRAGELRRFWQTNPISLISDVVDLAGQGTLAWRRERDEHLKGTFHLYAK